jgi:hypothetical protein
LKNLLNNLLDNLWSYFGLISEKIIQSDKEQPVEENQLTLKFWLLKFGHSQKDTEFEKNLPLKI